MNWIVWDMLLWKCKMLSDFEHNTDLSFFNLIFFEEIINFVFHLFRMVLIDDW